MSIESSQNWPAAEPPSLVPAPRRRWPLALFIALLVALAGAGGAYAWLTPGLFPLSAGRDAAEADSSDKAVLTDLLAAQQKTTDDLAAINQAIADQQEQLKAVMGQLAGLGAKIDALKNPAPQAAAAPTFPMPGPALAAPSTASAAPAPAARVAPRPKKPPRAPASSGPISVGGAPLNVAPDANPR